MLFAYQRFDFFSSETIYDEKSKTVLHFQFNGHFLSVQKCQGSSYFFQTSNFENFRTDEPFLNEMNFDSPMISISFR